VLIPPGIFYLVEDGVTYEFWDKPYNSKFTEPIVFTKKKTRVDIATLHCFTKVFFYFVRDEWIDFCDRSRRFT